MLAEPNKPTPRPYQGNGQRCGRSGQTEARTRARHASGRVGDHGAPHFVALPDRATVGPDGAFA